MVDISTSILYTELIEYGEKGYYIPFGNLKIIPSNTVAYSVLRSLYMDEKIKDIEDVELKQYFDEIRQIHFKIKKHLENKNKKDGKL